MMIMKILSQLVIWIIVIHINNTSIFPTVIAVTIAIKTTHTISTSMAKVANIAWPPVKHSTVPSMYHLCKEYKVTMYITLWDYVTV